MTLARVLAIGVAASLIASAVWFGGGQLLQLFRESQWNQNPQTTAVDPTPEPRLSDRKQGKTKSYTTEIEGFLGIVHAAGTELDYSREITAETGDTLYLYAWYYNRENVNSGLYASNLTVQFIASETRGQDQWVGVRIYGDNTNLVKKWVKIHVPEGNIVVEVPGSATWRHNRSKVDDRPKWVTEHVPGDLFGRGVILEDAGPCLLCEASVRVLLKVKPA